MLSIHLGLGLPYLETKLAQTVLAHYAALVHITVDTVDAAFASVLPDDIIALIGQYWLMLRVLGYHEGVFVNLAQQIVVVEILPCVEKGLLVISFFHHVDEFQQRIAKLAGAHRFGLRLYVYHRDKILVGREALGHEIAQLILLRHIGMIKMVGTNIQTVFVGQINIALISGILIFFTFGSLEIYVCHVAVVSKCLPPDVFLVVAHVKTMDVVACVLTLDTIRLAMA